MVSLFYGTGLGVYLSSDSSPSRAMTASVMYTVVTPMLNPFIYSLRNRDIRRALQKVFRRTLCVQWWEHRSKGFEPTVIAIVG